MVNQELFAYVSAQVAAHVRIEDIRAVLISSGWPQQEVDEVLLSFRTPPPPPPPPLHSLSAGDLSVHIVEKSVTPPSDLPASQKKPSRHVAAILSSILLLCIFAGAGYVAFFDQPILTRSVAALRNVSIFQKIGLLGSAPYSENDLISGLLDSSSRINSNTYSVTGSISVEPRDEGAVPFTLQVSNEEEIRQEYSRDYQRIRAIGSLLSELDRNKHYPASIKSVADTLNAHPYSKVSIADPKTQEPFEYSVTQGGKNFALSATFETKDAIRTIQKPSMFSASSSVEVHGQKVTFTSVSSPYIYLPSEPPKPYLVSLAEFARLIPAQLSASITAAASVDWSSDLGEWKFNVDASGDFGDLTYKVNADALKKAADYYFRVNNIPSLFGTSLAAYKGQWVKISPTAASSTSKSFDSMSYLASKLPEIEKKYKENREESVSFLREVAAIADQEHLLSFAQPPVSDSVDGEALYRYDLDINKSSIVPFYKKMLEAANSRKSISGYSLFSDPGTLDYLQSDEFSQVFDYITHYTTFTLWTDSKGYLRVFEYAMRVIPPDTAVALKDKQIKLIYRIDLSHINEPVVIEAPEGAKPIQDIISEVEANNNYSLDDARSNGRDARRLADVKQLQVALELYANDKSGQYPTSLSSLSPKYTPVIPKDPVTHESYVYAALGTGAKCSSYHLGAVLEATNSALSTDSDATVKKTCTGSAADFDGTSVTCTVGASVGERCFDISPVDAARGTLY